MNLNEAYALQNIGKLNIDFNFVCCSGNQSQHLQEMLASIAHLDKEIIIVDDSSTDDSVEVASKFTKHIIRLEPNWIYKNGFSRLHEYCLGLGKGKWTFLLDADERLILTKNFNLFPLQDLDTFSTTRLNVERIDWHTGVVANQAVLKEEVISNRLVRKTSIPRLGMRSLIHQIPEGNFKAENQPIYILHERDKYIDPEYWLRKTRLFYGLFKRGEKENLLNEYSKMSWYAMKERGELLLAQAERLIGKIKDD